MARGNTSTPQPSNELELLKAQVEILKESANSLTTALGKKRGTEPTLSFDTLSIEHTVEYHKFGSWMDKFLGKLNRWKIDDIPLRRVLQILIMRQENSAKGDVVNLPTIQFREKRVHPRTKFVIFPGVFDRKSVKT